MECSHDNRLRIGAADKRINTVLHLTGCLVGECQSKNIPWLDSVGKQMRYSIGEHTSLARTGTRHNQARTLRSLHCGTLHIVQLVEIVFHFKMYQTSANYDKKVKQSGISADIVFNKTANRIFCPNFYNIALKFEL